MYTLKVVLACIPLKWVDWHLVSMKWLFKCILWDHYGEWCSISIKFGIYKPIQRKKP